MKFVRERLVFRVQILEKCRSHRGPSTTKELPIHAQWEGNKSSRVEEPHRWQDAVNQIFAVCLNEQKSKVEGDRNSGAVWGVSHRGLWGKMVNEKTKVERR